MNEEGNNGGNGQAQAGEGYGCICGFTCLEKGDLGAHLMQGGKKDGKGVHKSLGRINLQTLDVVLPPYLERTAEQKAQTAFKVTSTKQPKVPKGQTLAAKTTESWEQATEFRVVPRVFQMDFTPTMRLAKVASIREWGWDDMAWADFFDTCLHTLFKEHGITLAGYIVHESVQETKEGVTA